jgi:hypothetical protein
MKWMWISPRRAIATFATAVCCWLGLSTALAAVATVHVIERGDVLDNKPFGKSGPYERIQARAYFAVDPKLPENQFIRDLGLAQTNSTGQVEFSADVYVLKPRDPAKGNGTILLEVPNRGGKGMLSRLCFAHPSVDPEKDEDFGDKWLLEEGYTLVWIGWQWDAPERPGLMRMFPPALRDGVSAPGLARSEFIPDRPTTHMPIADRGHQPVHVGKALHLYVRDSAEMDPIEITAGTWALTSDGAGIEMSSGFQPGRLYEFVFEGASPAIAGLGFAAVRDFVSFLKHGGGDDVALLSEQNHYLKRSIGYGVSQSGRFLRQLVYEGFNADEQGRKVFDGIYADVAGAGRGSFNFRYAQPSRDGHPWSNVFYPTDVFPFTGLAEKDPISGKEDGLLNRAIASNVVPKFFLLNTSYEYWGRAAALTHVDSDGRSDAPIPAETRMYFLSGMQHYPRSLPLSKAGERFDSNPTDQRPLERALFRALDLWIRDGIQPPPSVIPRLIKSELTTLADLHFPRIPGVTAPHHPRVARRLDFGPEFESKGISSIEPPKVEGAFTVLVPQTDSDGNDLGGVRAPEIALPLGTFTGWNFRAPGAGAPEQMANFIGSFFPFPRTRVERERNHDSRLSIEERYADRADYMRRVSGVLDSLIAQRFVLERDKNYVLERCGLLWDTVMKEPQSHEGAQPRASSRLRNRSSSSIPSSSLH